MIDSLRERLAGGDLFQGYAYAYPHKTAYRPLTPPVPLREVWSDEDRSALFLYAHVPFCEMRCGFCNLFTTTHPAADRVALYLSALERQAAVVSAALGDDARFARVAIGGGTPTFLTAPELAALFDALHSHFRIQNRAPVAVELSPATSTEDRLEILRAWNVSRVSLGVQSFVEAETRALGRPQRAEEVRAALKRLKDAGFPVLNLDLIYGIDGQTVETWRESIEAALEFAPEEIFLYPLYVRPLTGLARRGRAPGDARAALYRLGRDLLLARGWRQVSMRLFRAPHFHAPAGPEYCCQEDGMVGLGAGARTYTAALHYSTEWAVGRSGVNAIIDDFTARDAARFAVADYGCRLDETEQRRRYLIKSLLRADGLDAAAYCARFGSTVDDDFPCLEELLELGAVSWHDGALCPTERGLEWSDVIGPWLFSAATRARMETFALA